MLLKVENLQVSYGAIKAVQGISFEVEEGEIVCIIGANGAGKTSTLRAISRLVPVGPDTKITFGGKNLLKYPAHKVVDGGKRGQGMGLNMEDEIIRDTIVSRDGQLIHPRLRELLGLDPLEPSEPASGEGGSEPESEAKPESEAESGAEPESESAGNESE